MGSKRVDITLWFALFAPSCWNKQVRKPLHWTKGHNTPCNIHTYPTIICLLVVVITHSLSPQRTVFFLGTPIRSHTCTYKSDQEVCGVGTCWYRGNSDDIMWWITNKETLKESFWTHNTIFPLHDDTISPNSRCALDIQPSWRNTQARVENHTSDNYWSIRNNNNNTSVSVCFEKSVSVFLCGEEKTLHHHVCWMYISCNLGERRWCECQEELSQCRCRIGGRQTHKANEVLMWST